MRMPIRSCTTRSARRCSPLLPCVLLATIGAARLAPAAEPHPSLPADVVPAGLGVNIHFTDAQPGELEMLAAAGFRWVRMDFTWAATERQRGQYDFAAYDRLLAALDAHGLRALFILDYGNELYEPGGSVVSDAARAAYARWAAAAVTHFKGRGILWEIWNEPNIGFWKPKPDVNQYVALALASSQAMRAAAPGEAIVGPATSGVDLKFIESCCQAGLLAGWDAVSVHPYRQTAPETAAADYQQLRRLIDQHAPRDKQIPILSGEWGYSSAWRHFDEPQQGRMLSRQWLVNLASRVPLSIWYDWHDDGPDPQEPEHHFGTVAHEHRAGTSPVCQPKPAYLAARTLTSVLGGYRFTKRLALEGADDYALLFNRGDDAVLVVWTTSAAEHAVTIPASPGEFEVRTHTGEPGGVVTAKENGLLVKPGDAPAYYIARQPNAGLGAGE